ncbi:histidinolphosphatase [Rhizoclosmatium sp. JEL0117]|nr:histidinolphosphatase [Rhizoclosmatium sp. JEL0117]
MPVSLHSHSGQYCKHAKGTLREVVERAVQLGFTAYGLSEHMPRSRQQDLYPEEVELNMTPSDTTNQYLAFLNEARSLQLEFKDRIHLLVGMETEWIHGSTLTESNALTATHKLDYLVGSVHHVHEIPIDFDVPMYERAEQRAFEIAGSPATISPTECLFRDYYDAQYDLLVGLKPAVVGHFDLISMYRPGHPLSEVCWEKVKRNVAVIAEYGGIVEVNSRAWKKGLVDAYPQRAIVEYMKARGVKFCLSDDSHGPNDVGMHYSRLLKYLGEVGITEVYYPAPPSQSGSNSLICIENVTSLPFWKQFASQ